MAPKRGTHALAFAAFCAFLSVAKAGTFGELAPGAINVAEQSGVRAEICRDHLIEPAAFSAQLPEGYRLVPALEASKDEPDLAALIAQDQRLGSYAVGSLCFMSVENYDVDGVRVIAENAASPMAFWWVRAEREGEADARMQGRAQWIQIASWYAIEGTNHDLIRKSDPTAEFVPLSVEETAPGTWQVRLELPDQTVEGNVTVTGPSKKRGTKEPGFMTVAYSGKSAGYFTVFTYFGHRHTPVTGQWAARGKGAFVAALDVPREAETFATFFQSDWQARAALYELPR